MESGEAGQISSADTSIWKFLPKQISPYLFVLVVVCLIAFGVEAYFVSKIQFIGTSDPAHYSEVAENIILGKGFVMDYLNQYLYKFDTITHPEEYGFPGVSLLMVPFILLLGKTVFAIKLPSMIIGIVLFPILVYYLGKEFFEEKIGFLAAFSMIFYPTIFHLSFGGERDIMFAFFVVAGIYFFYRGLKTDETKYFVLMGAFLGYSYLIRQAAIAVLPVIFISYYLIKKNFSMKFVYGLIVGGLVVSPWLLRNYLVFGDPFFTVNKYAGWVMGYAAFFEQSFFQVYWHRPAPSLSFFVNTFGLKKFLSVFLSKVAASLSGQFTYFLVPNLLAFLGIVIKSNKEIPKNPSRGLLFLIMVGFGTSIFVKFMKIDYIYKFSLYAPMIAISFLSILFVLWRFFKGESKENFIFLLLWLSFAIFFSTIWVFDIRYWLIIVPFLLIYTWFALEKMVQKVTDKVVKLHLTTEQIGKILMIFLVIFILFSLPQTFGKFFDKNTAFPFTDDNRSILKIQLSETIKNSTGDDAVIMACDVGVLHFYSNKTFVEFPGSLESIDEVIKTYNVSRFVLFGCERRAIDSKIYSYLFDNVLNLTKADYAGDNLEFVTEDYSTGQTYKLKLPLNSSLRVFNIKLG